MKWSGGLGGRNALKSMGAGRAKSPVSDEPAKRFNGVRQAQCLMRATARGMQRESASVSLAKIAGTTPHILQSTQAYDLSESERM